MGDYNLVLSNQAERVIRRMAKRQRELYRRVGGALDNLARDPFQGKPLKGELQDRYSFRVGSYRILYRIKRPQRLVMVIDISHRRDVYR